MRRFFAGFCVLGLAACQTGSVRVTEGGEPGVSGPGPCFSPKPFYPDFDGDGWGEPGQIVAACSTPEGYADRRGDNCPTQPNPDQADVDGDGVGDVCFSYGTCGDLVEGNAGQLWLAETNPQATTQLQVRTDAPHRGERYLRAVTQAKGDFWLRFTVPVGGTLLDVSELPTLRLSVRAKTFTAGGWQANQPRLVVEDAEGRRRVVFPTRSQLPLSLDSWVTLRIPMGGDAEWTVSGEEVDPQRVRALELHADAKGEGLTLDLDGVSFEQPNAVCLSDCPQSCNHRGTCEAKTFTCACSLGASGTACETCAPGYSLREGQCRPAGAGPSGGGLEWPNAQSRANSDPWLATHHEEIQRLKPKVLVLNFANPGDPGRVQRLVDQVIAGFREGSRVQGFRNAQSPAQLEYQYAKPIVDLRDGVGGRAPAPAGFPYENSTLFPRRANKGSYYWGVDYAKFFSAEFAAHYGFTDPAQPGRFLTLCELVERGEVHEVWMVASGDVPDANAAEVLEAKPKYDASRTRIPGAPMERCAGNGCFDSDVPVCDRSVRIGFINYNRGPGCYLHSHGHGLEWTSNSNAIPSLSAWFTPFGAFDLRARGMPFNSFYDVSCTSEPCISFSGQAAVVRNGAQSYRLDPYDGRCGNVHFPPNARKHYDTANVSPVQSSCVQYGRGDATAAVSSADWSRYASLSPDCGGDFLVWWYQNMPGYGSGQSFSSGARMLSIWPFFFY